MSEAAPEAGNDPFGRRSLALLVVGGGGLFVLLLWLIAAGWTGDGANDGGGHVGGTGLNGYAGLARYLEARGFVVTRSRGTRALAEPGLLVLTPPEYADGAELDRIVSRRRNVGPTLVIGPKWAAAPLPNGTPGAKRGWVAITGVDPPEWKGFLDEVGVRVAPLARGGWRGIGLAGRLPAPRAVLSGAGADLAPLVVGEDGRVLAAYIDDAGYYPRLDAIPARPRRTQVVGQTDNARYPLVIVFEPDLLDNYGLTSAANARLGEALVRAADAGQPRVTFDLTLNGITRSANLLTLAFEPPVLAATLCLLLAATAAGWRAFARFGPPARPPRAIAFGKRALVANTAGLIARGGRLHLLGAPYAARARARLADALGLPRERDAAATDAAIDRALARRRAGGEPFSIVAARLEAARKSRDLLAAAQGLHALEAEV